MGWVGWKVGEKDGMDGRKGWEGWDGMGWMDGMGWKDGMGWDGMGWDGMGDRDSGFDSKVRNCRRLRASGRSAKPGKDDSYAFPSKNDYPIKLKDRETV